MSGIETLPTSRRGLANVTSWDKSCGASRARRTTTNADARTTTESRPADPAPVMLIVGVGRVPDKMPIPTPPEAGDGE